MTDANELKPTLDAEPPTPDVVNDTIRALYLNANNDVLALIAGTMNLYAEAKLRLTGKKWFTPEDAKRILDMAMILMDVPTASQDFTGARAPEGRSRPKDTVHTSQGTSK